MQGLNNKIHIFDEKSQLTSFTLSRTTFNLTIESN